jgi:glycosyltransferase involved in cell wall biosynthesis
MDVGGSVSEKPLRILMLNWWDVSDPRSGGAELHLQQIFGRIAQWGAEVTLLCCRVPGRPSEEMLDGIRIVRRGGGWTINLLAPTWVRARADQFDVVVDYTNKMPFLTPLYVPLPRLCVAHHINGTAFRREFPQPLAGLLEAAERIIYRRVYCRETFTAVSQSTADELVKLDIDPACIHVVHNGADHVDEGADGPRSTTSLLLYVGRLKRYKNLDHLLLALQALVVDVPDVQLAIVGDGDQRHRLGKLVQRLGLAERVIFCGPTCNGELTRWLSRAWVVVNPSSKEGWGLGVMEAARHGVPAVGADVPGLRDAIIDGETGLLVAPGDPARLCDALRRLIDDDVLRREMGQNARQRAGNFRWEQAATETLHIIESLVEPSS